MNPTSLYTRLRPVLRPFGPPYALLMRQRRRMFEEGRLASYSPTCPCVSVGNIAWGGAGKTPFVAWILERSRQRGLKAVVLTRGYKADPGKIPLRVESDSAPDKAGDEALMLARLFPEAAVLAFPKRAVSARLAEERLHPDLLVLDDGMQHLAVRRDVNIVLLRPDDLEEDWNCVIPAGPWREGASALASATIFAVKARPDAFAALRTVATERLAAFGRPLFSFCLSPVGLRPLFPSGASAAAPSLLEPGIYRDRPYILVSGVGNPEDVATTAARLIGKPPLQHFTFADHHPYSAGDVRAVTSLSAGPLPVVCTAKDAVKLRAFADAFALAPVWVLETELRFGPSLFTNQDFSDWWDATLGGMLSASRKEAASAPAGGGE